LSRPDERRSDLLVSVVAPLAGGDDVEGFVRQVSALLAQRFNDYELVLVDNATAGADERIGRLQRELRNIQLYTLARAVDSDACFVIGLERAIGDLVVTLDPASDPAERIADMIRVYDETGADIVYGVRRERVEAGMGSSLYDWAAKCFFALYRWITREDLPAAASSFRLYSRRALNSFLDNRDRYSLFPVVATFSGYAYRELPYDSIRTGKNASKPLIGGVGRALRILLLSSHRPLRLLSLAAVVGAGLNFLYSLWVVGVNLFKGDVAEGWTSLSLVLAMMFFLLFVILGVLCEYIGRLFMLGQDRPPYVIASESRSLVLARKRELNVRSDKGLA